LGEQPAVRERAWQEGTQALLSEELEPAVPVLEQNYSAELNAAVKDALTDSELFASYNLPARAIQPLEAVLSRAPRHVKLNQRLASLYLRTERLEETAQRCRVLKSVFAEAGLQAEARQYAELAEKYSRRSGHGEEFGSPAALPPQHPETEVSAEAAKDAGSVAAPLESVREATPGGAGVPGPETPELARMAPEPNVTAPTSRAAPPQVDAEPASSGETLAHEIDLSEEWERVLAAEQGRDQQGAELPTGFPPYDPQDRRVMASPDSTRNGMEEPGPADASSVRAVVTPATPARATIMDPALADIIEEARFYISQAMGEEARMALARAEILSPGAPQIAELQAQLATLPTADPQAALIEILSEVRPTDAPADADQTRAPVAQPSSSSAQPFLIAGVEADQGGTVASASGQQSRERPAVVPFQAIGGPSAELSRVAAPDSTPPVPVSDALSELVLELEESLGEDFLGSQPGSVVPAQHGPGTLSPKLGAGINMPKANVVSSGPMPPDLTMSRPAAPVFFPSAPKTATPETPVDGGQNVSGPAPMNTAELVPSEISDESAGLNGLFTEFKRDLESSSAESDDPETHYNLGVAFKEMGLLDEAIGEFQKVCKAIENGFRFPQAIQVYTWLADCFVQSGLPEAGIHWYEKALQVPGLDGEGILAIHYELARAHEAAGDLPAARRHFMHVLSRNIDYRDVAERIKTLKS
jgi:tetratricopeptide (TPR) repeat protein